MASSAPIAQQYAAAAASAANYSAAWILPSNRVLALRSVRNIDADAAESFVQWYAGAAGDNLEAMTPPFPVSLLLCS